MQILIFVSIASIAKLVVIIIIIIIIEATTTTKYSRTVLLLLLLDDKLASFNLKVFPGRTLPIRLLSLSCFTAGEPKSEFFLRSFELLATRTPRRLVVVVARWKESLQIA